MMGIKVPTLVIIGLMVFFFIVPFWKILAKAGFSRWLSVLMIVPLVNVVVLFYVAFARWPVRRELEALRKKSAPKKSPRA
jgi:hypothetical protein